MKRALAVLVGAAVLGGCATSEPSADKKSELRVVTEASAPEKAALIERVKSLEGEWTKKSEDGEGTESVIFKVSSNGSVVREIMFPGTGHEMTNVYHMDGPTLVMTHYCAIGNQPRLRATAGTRPNTVELKLDSISNFTAADGQYMGDLTLVLVDPNTLREEWKSYKSGAIVESTTFEFKRKK